jgi:hypothetical protein
MIMPAGRNPDALEAAGAEDARFLTFGGQPHLVARASSAALLTFAFDLREASL